MLEVVDPRKQLKALYNAFRDPVVVDVPAMNFLMVDGHGDPNTSPLYADVVAALYGVSFTLKFALKRAGKADYKVMPLEGLWWAKDPRSFVLGDKKSWYWTAMIMQPDLVTAAHVHDAIATVRAKKRNEMLAQLRFESFAEGRAAQLMHIGPYAAEAPNIERLHAFIHSRGGELTGKHHEIYLGDPRRAAADRLKTIIRQPFNGSNRATSQ